MNWEVTSYTENYATYMWLKNKIQPSDSYKTFKPRVQKLSISLEKDWKRLILLPKEI